MMPRVRGSFLILIAFACISWGCGYDWDVAPAGGSGGSSGQTGGGGAGTVGQPFTCDLGASCTCSAARSSLACPTGTCTLSSGGVASCPMECPGGDCTMRCSAGSTCDMVCLGGRCSFVCEAGSTCSGSCLGGACTPVECAEGATCTF